MYYFTIIHYPFFIFKIAMKITLPFVLAVILGHTALAQSPPPMPNLVGEGLVEALRAFDPETKIDEVDISGSDRQIVWPANWKVCTQNPEAGNPLMPDMTVKVGAVKKTEGCPKGA